MIIRAISCRHCGQTITSRSNYDYVTCKCGQLSVDGGVYTEEVDILGFGRIIGSFQKSQFKTLDVPLTYSDVLALETSVMDDFLEYEQDPSNS